VNCASQPTLSLAIWQRVWPDLVSMNTWPLPSGGSGIAPAGGLPLDGADGVGLGDGIDGLAFGNVGSVGPAPDDETAFPWMSELHPLTRAALSSSPASSRPPVPVVVNPCGNIANQGYAGARGSGGSDARLPDHGRVAVGQSTKLAGAVATERSAVHQRKRARRQLRQLLQCRRQISGKAGGVK
jgi:hypothetical protein